MAISFYSNFSARVNSTILKGVQNASADLSRKYDTAWGAGGSLGKVENATPIATMSISCLPGFGGFTFNPAPSNHPAELLGASFSIGIGNGEGATIPNGYINSSSLKVSVGSLPIITIGIIGTELIPGGFDGTNSNTTTIDDNYQYLPKNYKVSVGAIKSYISTTTVPYAFINNFGSIKPSFIYSNDLPKTIVQIESYSASTHVVGRTYDLNNDATNFLCTNKKYSSDIGSIGTSIMTYESTSASAVRYSL
jgi:hypothetical protein